MAFGTRERVKSHRQGEDQGSVAFSQAYSPMEAARAGGQSHIQSSDIQTHVLGEHGGQAKTSASKAKRQLWKVSLVNRSGLNHRHTMSVTPSRALWTELIHVCVKGSSCGVRGEAKDCPACTPCSMGLGGSRTSSPLPTPRKPRDLNGLTRLNGVPTTAVAQCHRRQSEEVPVPEEVTCLSEERGTGFPFSSAFILPRHASLFPPKDLLQVSWRKEFLLNSRFGTDNQSGMGFERSRMQGLV